MSTMNLSDLRLLGVFATVVEAGSFAAAARSLHSSRSRISEQVAQLERRLGVRLLHRSTRKLVITAEGAEVFEQARRLGDILHRVEAVATAGEPRGRVRLTLNHDLAHAYLLPRLNDFRAQFPQIQLELILDDHPRDLISDQIDLGIRIGLVRDESLVARILHEERLGIFASQHYLQRTGMPTDLDALAAADWISLVQTSPDDVQHFRHEDQTIEIRPSTIFRCNSPLMVKQMIRQGLGVGALLPSTVRQELERGEIVQIMPSLSSDPLIFSLVYPSRKQLPPRTQAVIDYLRGAQLFQA